jgi:hypothetical protein
MKYKIFKFLERTYIIEEKAKFLNNLFYFLFAPFYFILESICKRSIWRTVILTELITNEQVFDFFCKHEFEYNKGQFRKVELLNSNEYYDTPNTYNFKKIRERIKRDYVNAFKNLFSHNIPFDIENYVTLMVNVDVKAVNNNGDYLREPVYEVLFYYCRRLHWLKSRNNFIIWMILASIIGILTYLI